MNTITIEACLDITVNETSLVHQGWGEPKSGLVRIIINNPGFCKGGQFVHVSDVDSIWMWPYFCQHKLW